jgi:hypothetical protein
MGDHCLHVVPPVLDVPNRQQRSKPSVEGMYCAAVLVLRDEPERTPPLR